MPERTQRPVQSTRLVRVVAHRRIDQESADHREYHSASGLSGYAERRHDLLRRLAHPPGVQMRLELAHHPANGESDAGDDEPDTGSNDERSPTRVRQDAGGGSLRRAVRA